MCWAYRRQTIGGVEYLHLPRHANGTYAVRAVFMDGYAEGSFSVNVQDNAVFVTGVKLDKTKLTLAVGKNVTLTATVDQTAR